ncbi:hypothetical protein K435DRAFT_858602 [Dendrothele bispora CBS 962.96]|uniref:Uncharacterized protein n=1 Tax=Dendrothele bispora (strain CBS 962.96) TaxID=1314807 RepID=A0A4S8M2P0_DENBC|nr:hypothetical protein K435DRAFT_858602 [Dendrothele bispora CBS 962.96]
MKTLSIPKQSGRWLERSAIKPGKLAEGLKELVTGASLCDVATCYFFRHCSHSIPFLARSWGHMKTYYSRFGENKEDLRTSTGDPTEVALRVFFHKLGMGRPLLVAPGSPASSPFDPSSEPQADWEKQPLDSDVIAEDVDDEKQCWDDAFFPSSHSSKRFRLKTEYPFDSSLKRMSLY